jgi:RimJ/RimL family protein N-acetyltransferase
VPCELPLLDGTSAAVRPVRAADEPALEAFFTGLGSTARHTRFFTAAIAPDRIAAWAAGMEDGEDGVGLVAFEDGRLVAHAVACPTHPGEAEVAFAVADDRHGVGLATGLLHLLAERADDVGAQTFLAEVLPHNHEMLDVLRHAGDTDEELSDGVDHVRLDVAVLRGGNDGPSSRA